MVRIARWSFCWSNRSFFLLYIILLYISSLIERLHHFWYTKNLSTCLIFTGLFFNYGWASRIRSKKASWYTLKNDSETTKKMHWFMRLKVIVSEIWGVKTSISEPVPWTAHDPPRPPMDSAPRLLYACNVFLQYFSLNMQRWCL